MYWIPGKRYSGFFTWPMKRKGSPRGPVNALDIKDRLLTVMCLDTTCEFQCDRISDHKVWRG